MATLRQKKAVDKLVENGGIVSKAMIAAGYSPATAKTPQKLTEGKGFQQELAKHGLTEGFITQALVSDIQAKPKKRFFELSLGADILGMKKRSYDGPAVNVGLFLTDEQVDRLIQRRTKETIS